MSRPPTIIDVATRAGVSKSLVSMVLRGDTGVSPARRSAVLDAVAELGYRPNRAAAILAGNRTRTVGIVIDDFRNPWYIPLLDGVRAALAPHGLRLTVADGASNRHLGSDPFDDLVSLRVDGIILAGEPRPDIAVPADLPVVVAGIRSGAVPGADVVAADEHLSGRIATDHLLALGHSAIGHLTGSGGAGHARLGGYRTAMGDAGHRALVFGDGGTTEQDGYRAATALLDAHPEVTAVFASNDVMAMGALAAAREHGRGVPEALSVIGCDDSPLAASPLLRLTTVDVRSEEVGHEAAEALLARLDEPAGPGPATGAADAAGPGRRLLEPRLVVRASTAAR